MKAYLRDLTLEQRRRYFERFGPLPAEAVPSVANRDEAHPAAQPGTYPPYVLAEALGAPIYLPPGGRGH